MKKIFFVIFVIFSVFSIYVLNFNEKKNIVFLGDYLLKKSFLFLEDDKEYNYNKNFVFENYHITDLINMINENIEREQTSIKQNLIKADFVILSIGMNDYTSVEYLSNKNENLLSLQNDYVRLFEILRKNTKEKIIMIGLYDNTSCNSFSKSLFELNEFLKHETKIYSIDYIDILKEMKDINNLKCDSVYPTLYGYSLIENKIIAILNS